MRVVRALLFTTAEAGILYLLAFFVFGRTTWGAYLTDPVAARRPFFVGRYALPRIIPVLFLLASLALTAPWRVGYARVFTSPFLRRRAIVVGAGWAGRTLVRAVRQTLQGYDIVGFIDDDPAKQGQIIEDLPVLGNRYDLVRQVQATGADEVILAITYEIHGDLFKALVDCCELGVEIKPMPLLYEEALGRVPVEHLGQKWFLVPTWTSTSLPTFYRAIKRLIDITLALVGLAFLVVTFPFIALAIYLDSPGPIFYTQERLGKGGKVFRVIKFRSMIPNAEREGQAVWATENDPRITRVGKFLRRTRLDEVPQVINVLRGEMSVVGPRPERPQFVEQLQEQIPFYRTRLSVKPGLTGWAQIKYRYGNTVEDALIKLQYDLYYIKHQSLVLDLLIILRTIKVILAFKGT